MKKYPIREPFNNLKYGKKQEVYKKLLISLYGREDTLEESPINLRDIYTPLVLKDNKTDKELSIEEILCSYQFIAISGVAGSGKSTITKFLSIETSQNGLNKTVQFIGKRLVMPIILRELDFEKIDSLDSLFDAWIDNINQNLKKSIFDREFFDFYISKGWAILIFDGFDEIGAGQNRKLIEWLSSYLSTQKLQSDEIRSNIVITARPTGFLNDINYSNFAKFDIEPYNENQIESYIGKYMTLLHSPNQQKTKERIETFSTRLKSIDDLKQLKSRPIYLMMLCYISEHKGEIPRSRVLAYQLMVEAYIHILDKQRNLLNMPNWDYQDKYIMLEELAYKIHLKATEEKDSGQLHIEVSQEEIKEYFKEIVKDEDEKLKSIEESEKIEKIMKYYLSRSGLLVESREGFIQFSHFSFQEYLTASKIYRDRDDLDLIEYLNDEIFDKLEGNGFAEVAQLYFGIDSLKGGKNQFKITERIFKDSLPYHEFIYNLILISENRLKEREELKWLKTLIYSWINREDIYNFSKLIEKFEQKLKEYRGELHKEIEGFIFQIAEQILRDAIEYELKIKKLKIEKLDKFKQLKNILYIGFWFEDFRDRFLTSERLELFPKDTRGKNFQFWLDNYIIYNEKLKEHIASSVISNISVYQFLALNGSNYLLFSPLFIKNTFFRIVLKLQLQINKNLFFLQKDYMLETKIRKFYMYMFVYLYMDNYMDIALSFFGVMNIPNIRNIAMRKNMDMAINLSRSRGRSISTEFYNIDGNINYENQKEIYSDISDSIDLALDRCLDINLNLKKEMIISKEIINKSSFTKDNIKFKNILGLSIRYWLFSIYASSKRYAKEVGLDIGISKNEFIELYRELKENPIGYFEKEGFALREREKEEIEELFEKSYLLKAMELIVESEYEEFDEVNEKKAIEDFHNSIKEFNEKYGKDLDKL